MQVMDIWSLGKFEMRIKCVFWLFCMFITLVCNIHYLGSPPSAIKLFQNTKSICYNNYSVIVRVEFQKYERIIIILFVLCCDSCLPILNNWSDIKSEDEQNEQPAIETDPSNTFRFSYLIFQAFGHYMPVNNRFQFKYMCKESEQWQTWPDCVIADHLYEM